MKLAAAFCIVFLSVGVISANASYGKLIYAQAFDKRPYGSSDVFERNLDTGKSQIIIPYKSLPKDFRGYISYLSVSGDGRYLMIGVCTKPYEGNSIPATPSISRLWLWNRKTRNVVAVPRPSGSPVGWSHGSRCYAFLEYDTQVSWYDAVTGKLKIAKLPKTCQEAVWSSTRESLLLACAGYDEKTTVYEQPMSGRRLILFGGLVGILSLEQSPSGQRYALCDGKSVYTIGKGGSRKRRLPIATDADHLNNMQFSYSSADSKLAIVNRYSYGEPAVNTSESLWVADVSSSKATSLASWVTSVPPYGGTSIFHWIEGWASDSKSVLVSAEISSDSKYGYRSDWHQIWAYSLTGPKNKGRPLFDSGPGCLAITWWPGK